MNSKEYMKKIKKVLKIIESDSYKEELKNIMKSLKNIKLMKGINNDKDWN